MFLVSSFSRISMIERLMALSDETPSEGATEEEKAQLLLKAIDEKKTAISLIEKFAFSVKDYLRGGKDIDHQVDITQMSESPANKLPEDDLTSAISAGHSEIRLQSPTGSEGRPREAEPPTSATLGALERDERLSADIGKTVGSGGSVNPFTTSSSTGRPDPVASTQAGLQRQESLLPVNDPSDQTRLKFSPLRRFIEPRTVVGKRPVDLEARDGNVIRDVPLQIILCLSRYVAEIQRRKIADVPTINPFGYDRNHLNLDYFTEDIRSELAMLTARPPPGAEDWPRCLDDVELLGGNKAPLTPREQMQRGEQAAGPVLRRGQRKMLHSGASYVPPRQIRVPSAGS
ncbi:hypothetical protein FRC00_001174 [Tulasnella sp. 408]|nr:hypothetical protein FRC00_001174 [Tulasnella sp. 408]